MGKTKRRDITYKDWITEEGLLKLSGWAKDGLIDKQISYNIGIHPSTLYEWKKKYPRIDEALKVGKEVVDRQVENALLKRALGYEYVEIKNEETDAGTTTTKTTTTKTTKQVVPDVTAQIFWLKNRKPAQWRDKQNIEHSGTVNNPMSDLTTDDLKKLIKDG